MYTYKIRTYVDITNPRADRTVSDYITRGQQSNFNTLIQTIGLRANITWRFDPEQFDDCWVWIFEVERPDIYLKGDDSVGLLIDDLHNVPVIGNLSNIKAIYPPVFKTIGPDRNTWITSLHS
jgi:hypothetical protein